MSQVPNTTTFSLQDVVDVVNPNGSEEVPTDKIDLKDCFAAAEDILFDSFYKGSKNSLLNFRNYGSCVIFKYNTYRTGLQPTWKLHDATLVGTDSFNVRMLPLGWLYFGAYTGLGHCAYFWTSTLGTIPDTIDTGPIFISLCYHNSDLYSLATNNNPGASIRCCRDITSSVKDTTIFPDAYTDGNGNKYDAVKIGGRLITTTNLRATKLQNGTNLSLDDDWELSSDLKYARINGSNDFVEDYGYFYPGSLAAHDTYKLVDGDGWRVMSLADIISIRNTLVATTFCGNRTTDGSEVINGLKAGRVDYTPTLITPKSFLISGRLAESQLSTNYESGSSNESMSSTDDWYSVIRNGSTWITVTPSSGTSSTSNFTIQYAENYLFSTRTDHIDFYIDNERLYSIEVTQGAAPYFEIEPSGLIIDGDGTSIPYTINIDTNLSNTWTSSNSNTWMSILPTSGTGSSTALTVQANNTGSSRTGYIYFSCGGFNETLAITQPAAIEPSLSASPTSAGFTSTGGTKTIYVTFEGGSNVTVTPEDTGDGTDWFSVSVSNLSSSGNFTITVGDDYVSSRSGRVRLNLYKNGSVAETMIVTVSQFEITPP